jgi:DNA-binding CsgD family transcriptional regulator/PAS domain-containing protein
MIFHFAASLSSGEMPKQAVYLAYLPVPLFVVKTLEDYIYLLVESDAPGRLRFEVAAPSPWYYGFVSYALGCIFAGLLLLWIYRGRRSRTRERRQILVIFLSLLIGIVLATLEEVVLPAVTDYSTRGLSVIFALIFVVGSCFALIRYRLACGTHTTAHLIDAISSPAMVVDREGMIVAANRALADHWEVDQEQCSSWSIAQLLAYGPATEQAMLDVWEGRTATCDIEGYLPGAAGHAALNRMALRAIANEFGETVAILVVSTDGPDAGTPTLGNLTNRELEVVEGITAGLTNKQIGAKLGITERTVKAHVTKIYRKLGIENKAQLLHLMASKNPTQ